MDTGYLQPGQLPLGIHLPGRIMVRCTVLGILGQAAQSRVRQDRVALMSTLILWVCVLVSECRWRKEFERQRQRVINHEAEPDMHVHAHHEASQGDGPVPQGL